MKNIPKTLTREFGLAPKGLLILAGVMVLIHCLFNICGFKSYTSFISGTIELGASTFEAAARGGIYIITHFLATAIAPVLVLTAAILSLWKEPFDD